MQNQTKPHLTKMAMDLSKRTVEMQPVSVRFERTTLDQLRALSHRESLRRNRGVSMADLIREAVCEAYLLVGHHQSVDRDAADSRD